MPMPYFMQLASLQEDIVGSPRAMGGSTTAMSSKWVRLCIQILFPIILYVDLAYRSSEVIVTAAPEESVEWALMRPLPLAQPHQYCLLKHPPLQPAPSALSGVGENVGCFIMDGVSRVNGKTSRLYLLASMSSLIFLPGALGMTVKSSRDRLPYSESRHCHLLAG